MPANWRFVDTLPLFRTLLPQLGSKKAKPYKLENLHKHLGLGDINNGHRALGDVEGLEKCLRKVITKGDFTEELLKAVVNM